MPLLKPLLAATLLTATLAGPLAAAPIQFTIDAAPGSSVGVESNPTFCVVESCALSAELAYATPLGFALEEGESVTFDFARFTVADGLGKGLAGVTATLAFLDPEPVAATSAGSGWYLSLFGVLTAGSLAWAEPVHSFALGGLRFSAAFADIAGIGHGGVAYAPVTITLESVDTPPTPVPEPAVWTALAAGAALGAGLWLRRRRRRA